MLTTIERAIRFFDASCKGLHTKIEPTNTDRVILRGASTTGIGGIRVLRILVISDGLLTNFSRELGDRLGERRVVAELYGIGQLYRIIGERETRADITVDVVQARGGGSTNGRGAATVQPR